MVHALGLSEPFVKKQLQLTWVWINWSFQHSLRCFQAGYIQSTGVSEQL